MSIPNDQTIVTKGVKIPHVAPSDSWQIQKAIKILKEHQDDDQWAGCYMGTWPVYTLGFFLDETEHMDIIRKDLDRRWEVTGFMQVVRFREELETTWRSRSCGPPIPEFLSSELICT